MPTASIAAKNLNSVFVLDLNFFSYFLCQNLFSSQMCALKSSWEILSLISVWIVCSCTAKQLNEIWATGSLGHVQYERDFNFNFNFEFKFSFSFNFIFSKRARKFPFAASLWTRSMRVVFCCKCCMKYSGILLMQPFIFSHAAYVFCSLNSEKPH